MKHPDAQIRIAQFSAYCIGLVLVLLPFHAVFTTWLGSNFGHFDLFRIWKELLVAALVPIAAYLALSDVRLRHWLKSNWLPRLILLYLLLHLIMGVVALERGSVNRTALIYALLSNLRYLGFFMIVVVVAAKSNWLYRHWKQLVIIPAIVVISFGLLQRFVLPYDILRHVGYGPHTIPAYQTIDEKLAFRRVQSTLRGSNPLGAYLVLVLPLMAYGMRKGLKRSVALFAGGVVLFYTYSRSAWIGFAVSLFAMTFWLADSKRRRKLGVGLVITLLILVAGVLVLRDNAVVENSIFHTDSTSKSATSSNASRLGQTEQAVRDIVHEPVGRGPGTAGPASSRNNHAARIAENYFLQIGQEVGLIGIALLIVINVLVALALWRHRSSTLAAVLLATLIGLTVVNLVSHAWADDTLAYLWWGLAAIALSPAILQRKAKHHA